MNDHTKATAAETAEMAEVRQRLRSQKDWLQRNALAFRETQLAPPADCICGTPLYRHPTVLGGYYRPACLVGPGMTVAEYLAARQRADKDTP